MNALSQVGWNYLIFGMLTCGFFCAAAIGGWSGPDVNDVTEGRSSGNSFYNGSSSSRYGRSSTSGRSWGGSWGGGK